MAALARIVDDAPPPAGARTVVNGNGLRALLFEDVQGDAFSIGHALQENPRILSVTRVTAGRTLKVIDKDGVVPDFAIFNVQPPCTSGFEMIVMLGAKLKVLYADPAASGMPVVILTTPSPPHSEAAANSNIVELAARLDGIISEVVPRAQRS